ncbi:hypothetical protein B0H21DRAFT_487229 [Amylocystis lapponica]|nr:hypothetical protein B0H21DRAFT_487229 [Amylocystis lapponica]
MSRQSDSASPSEDPSPKSSFRPSSQDDSSRGAHPQESLVPDRQSQSPQGVSSSSEGYPSWLPKRPPPPAPRSTLQSSIAGMYTEAGPSNEPFVVGRKPTPRSVRIVSLQGSSQGEKDDARQPRREPTDQSRVWSNPAHARVWSRATSAGLTPTLLGSGMLPPSFPRPRFRSPALHTELLRNPSWRTRLLFYLFPLFVFAHIPLQTFFDFNAVYMLILVAKYPNPAAPGVPGSGRSWTLGAAAYIACWFTWIFVVFIVYDLVYSFIRRWRVKRPLMFPIYTSAPAFNFAAMTSYTNFCFLYHIRTSAFSGEHGGLRDGFAETAYYYSQNLPTVALLLPRAALALALLLSFWLPNPNAVALANAGISARDGTFFRADGTLTRYARGVLIANAAWAAWRALVYLLSLVALWILSGQCCAGLCGPRYRWEEDDAEKTVSAFSGDALEDVDALPWSWKECTLLRIKDAYDFCLTTKPPRPASGAAAGAGGKEREPSVPFTGIERVFAAVGLPSTPHHARRPMLSDELFESPVPPEDEQEVEVESVEPERRAELSGVIPPVAAAQSKEKVAAGPSGPLMKLPYPFTGYGAQVSSEDVVPFPPSPTPEEEIEVPIEGATEEGEDEEEGDDDDGDEEEEEEELEEESEEPSDRRTSGSMSSLGRPVTSRYPFQFRRPARGSVSSASHVSPHTQSTPHSTMSQSRSAQSRSTQSRSTRHSRSTQSTGNRESTDSPRSNPSSNAASPLGSSFSSSGIPMPPRHPQVQRRARAGTVPGEPSSPASPTPVVFPGRPRARTRTESVGTDTSMTFGPIPGPAFDSDGEQHDESLMDVPEAEGSVEEAEQHDSVGLLSAGPSPRASLINLRHRGSALAHRRSNGSRSRSGPGSRSGSGSDSRSRTNSANSNSRSESARSRAQSLIQSLGAASRSSLDLVRSRANSMARLSDSPFDSASASDAVLSSPENHTFGHPLREQWRADGAPHDIEDIAEVPVPVPVLAVPADEAAADADVSGSSGSSGRELRTAASTVSHGAQSEWSVQTERVGIPIPGRQGGSQPDISTADQSFVTAAATVQGTTSSSDRTPPSRGEGAHDWTPGGARWLA